jgi:hypothetical protein
MVRGRDGLWHLFVSEMAANCSLAQWQTNSRCVHAVASTPDGPFARAGVAIAPWCHLPHVTYLPAAGEGGGDVWALWHAGSGTSPPARVVACNASGAPPLHAPAPPPALAPAPRPTNGDPNVIHTAPSPYGPWTLSTAPLPDCWSPSPLRLHNGTWLALCGWTSLWAAPALLGPWRHVLEVPTGGTPGNYEDPTLWQDPRGNLHVFFHTFTMDNGLGGCKLPNCDPYAISGHSFSRDGAVWFSSATQPFSSLVNVSDGSVLAVSTRERPKVVVNPDSGEPTHLVTAVCPTPHCPPQAAIQCKVQGIAPNQGYWTHTLVAPLDLSAPTPGGAAPAPVGPNLALTVHSAPLAAPTPRTFLGFSGDEATLGVLSWRASAAAPFSPRPSFTALMRLLGGSVNLRFGHFFAPGSTTRQLPPSYMEVNSTTCARIADALSAINGTLSALIPPLDTADGAFAAAAGAALLSCLGAHLNSVELANEPDISSFKGNYTGYVRALTMWLDALEAAGARRLVDAPVLAEGAWWPEMRASFLPAFAPRLCAFVQHRYALTACRGAAPTPEALMLASTTWATANDTALLGAVAGAGLRFVLGEGNSVSCNGTLGVSDVFASALYAMDASLSAAAANISAYKWHGLGLPAPLFSYQPVYYDTVALAEPGRDEAAPRPLFLGLWALADAGLPGGTLLRVDAAAAGSELLRAWALRPAGGGAARVVVLHKDGAAPAATVTIAPPGARCVAGQVARAALLLPGPGGLSARAGCSFGNQTFDGTSGGAPAGNRWEAPVPCNAATGLFEFTLQPTSGAVVFLPE